MKEILDNIYKLYLYIKTQNLNIEELNIDLNVNNSDCVVKISQYRPYNDSEILYKTYFIVITKTNCSIEINNDSTQENKFFENLTFVECLLILKENYI